MLHIRETMSNSRQPMASLSTYLLNLIFLGGNLVKSSDKTNEVHGDPLPSAFLLVIGINSHE